MFLEIFVSGLVCFILFLNVLSYFLEKFRNHKVRRRPAETIVVITGCDSGFGELTSRELAKQGYKVIAACLTDEGMERLKNVVAVVAKCDVMKESDISALAAATEKYAASSGCSLWGVVNNAGIADGGNLDWTEMSVWRRVMEVNFFAVVGVTKSMMHMLKKTPGSRVVNVSSLAGISGGPALGAYCASKHAVEGMAKCAREELAHWSIHMSNINPGFMRTNIITNGSAAAKRSLDAAPADITSEYNPVWMEEQLKAMNGLAEDPKLVVDAIIDALTDTHPPMWYFPGYAARILRLFPLMSSGVVDWFKMTSSNICAKPTPEAMKKYR